jgi:signal transduction histidine kinase
VRALSFPGLLHRRPARFRLTVIYTGLFLVAGALLLAATYGLVASSLPTSAGKMTGAAVSASYPGLRPCEASSPAAAGRQTCKEAAAVAMQRIADAGVRGARAQTLSHLLSYSLAGLAVMAVLAAFLGWVVAGRILRPVHAITAAARLASEDNLSQRIGLPGPEDELKELADTFDEMLARLESAFASQRRFVANASHELRTPLTVMRTAIDVTLAKPRRTPEQLEAMAVDVRRAVEQAESLIEALLTLARSDRGLGPRSSFDMAVLAEDALDAVTSAAQGKRLTVRSELRPGAAAGDPVLAERLVTNLIGNAVRHNTPDGWIHVTTGCIDGMAFISVANSGPVVPDAAVPFLFEPFYRLAQGSGTEENDGAGLGLSIAESVVAAHRGHVSARPVPQGGLEVTAMLPAR